MLSVYTWAHPFGCFCDNPEGSYKLHTFLKKPMLCTPMIMQSYTEFMKCHQLPVKKLYIKRLFKNKQLYPKPYKANTPSYNRSHGVITAGKTECNG